VAHYSSTSQISLRLLSRQVEETGRDFLLRRIRAAEQHRKMVVRNSSAYRVVHGEADLLPALVVDRYGDYLVMQTLSQGMDAAKSEIVSCLEEIFQPKGIVARNDVHVRTKEQLPLETAIVSGEIPDSVQVEMNGLSLAADLLHGQKTGLFLDQRLNRRRAESRASGRRALDLFCYQGEWALHAARGGAREVLAIDSSEPALAAARRNLERNGHAATVTFHGLPVVTVKPAAVKRCLANLVSNAARYADAISITGHRDHRYLSVTVDDDGPGIPPGMREEVFKPFLRLDDARNQDEGGTGLGLAITRDIARSHGGDITLGDSPMGGLRATVRIPV